MAVVIRSRVFLLCIWFSFGDLAIPDFWYLITKFSRVTTMENASTPPSIHQHVAIYMENCIILFGGSSNSRETHPLHMYGCITFTLNSGENISSRMEK